MPIIFNTYFYLIMMLIRSDWWADLCKDSTETVTINLILRFLNVIIEKPKEKDKKKRTRWPNKSLFAFSPFSQILFKVIWLFSTNKEDASFYLLCMCKSMSRTQTNCQWNVGFTGWIDVFLMMPVWLKLKQRTHFWHTVLRHLKHVVKNISADLGNQITLH